MSERTKENPSQSSEHMQAQQLYFSESDSCSQEALDASDLTHNVEIVNGRPFISVDYLERIGVEHGERVIEAVERAGRVQREEEALLGLFSLHELKQLCFIVAAFGISTVSSGDVQSVFKADISEHFIQSFIVHYRRLIRREYGLNCDSDIENWMIPTQYCFGAAEEVAEAWRTAGFRAHSLDYIISTKDKID